MSFLSNFRRSILFSLIISGLVLFGCQSGGDQEGEATEEGPATQERPQQGQQQQQQQRQQGQNPMQQRGPEPAENVSDEELKQFAEAIQKIQEVQRSTQGEMKKAIDEEDMDAQRFNEIMKKERNPKKEADMTKKEEKQYKRINKKIQKIRSESRPKMESAIKEVGLDMQRYQAIMKAIRQDTSLQQRLQKHMPSPKMQQGQPQGRQ